MRNNREELQLQNNKLDANINTENQEIFTDMICYIRGANISDYNQELVRHDLTEMILSAQNRGENIHDVIGGDFKEFCDCVISSLPPKTKKEKLIDFLDILCGGLSFLGAINIVVSKDLRAIIQGLLAKETVNFNIGISLGNLISIAIIIILSIVIVETIMKNAFKKQSKRNRVLQGCLAGAGIMAVFICVMKFGSAVVFSVNIFFAIALIVALFTTHKLLNKI